MNQYDHSLKREPHQPQVLIQPDAARVAIVESNTVERMRFIRQCGSAQHADEDGVAWISTGIPYPNVFLNLVFSKSTEHGLVSVEEALATVQQWRVPAFWGVASATITDDVDAQICSHHLQQIGTAWEMALDLAQLPQVAPLPPELTIRRVENRDDLGQFLRILSADHPAPDPILAQWLDFETSLSFAVDSAWQRYLGLWHGEPVATVALFLGAQSAGIYHVETAPNARGRGIGTAITHHALKEAYWRCYGMATLIATPMGFNIYRKLGFVAHNQLSVYMRQHWN